MIDERAFLHHVESAEAGEFAKILRSADSDQERAMRAHFGDAAFERLRSAAETIPAKTAARLTAAPLAVAPKPAVIVLNGILGSELAENGSNLWVSILEIVAGKFGEFALDAAGASVHSIAATGLLKKYYGELLLTLAPDWNVRSFPFDWRLDIRASADDLASKIAQWFPGQPVHLIAHSMGGLVARSLIVRHPDLWNAIAPGRLVMLGAPNYGAFAIPLLFSGLNETMRTVAKLDLHHTAAQLLQIAKTFPGIYQMLPALSQIETAAPLYVPATYGSLDPLLPRFDDTRQFQTEIENVIDPDRMIYVAGYNRATADGVSNYAALTDLRSYTLTKRGDGTVPHSLGLLKDVPTFYVDEEHAKLPANPRVLQAIPSLLETGTVAEPILWHGLSPNIPGSIRGLVAAAHVLVADLTEDLHSRVETKMAAHAMQAEALCDSLMLRGGPHPDTVAPEESQLRDLLIGGMSLDSSPQTEPVQKQ